MTPLEALADPTSKRVAVFAHPDDETLWAGGLLLRFPGAWRAVCCSIPARDPARIRDFYEAARKLGALPSHLRYRETGKLDPFDHLDALPSLADADVIVTHGAAGSYGHLAHRRVYAVLAARYPGRLVFTGYGESVPPDLVVALSDAEWKGKIAALKCYAGMMRWQGLRVPTWEALLDEYGSAFDLRNEPFIFG